MVSVSRFALLRASVLISAWSQSLNFTWRPSNLRQKGSPHFSMLFALVCCDSCFDFGDVCTFISVLRWHTACLINMASLYIYLCGDDTTRVFYIYGVVCVKFVNRQAKVGKRSNQQVCL